MGIIIAVKNTRHLAQLLKSLPAIKKDRKQTIYVAVLSKLTEIESQRKLNKEHGPGKKHRKGRGSPKL
jgi:hypothetical protein